MPDNIVVQIEEVSVVLGDISTCDEIVEEVLLQTSTIARGYFQAVLFWFPDYDNDPREVYEIQEVRSWFQKVNGRYPYFLYFMAPEQYFLYLCSQKYADKDGLTLWAVEQFVADHEKAIKEFCDKIGDNFDAISTKMGVGIREMVRFRR